MIMQLLKYFGIFLELTVKKYMVAVLVYIWSRGKVILDT